MVELTTFFNNPDAAIGSLQKSYTAIEKFSGTKTDDFDGKLELSKWKCSINRIPNREMHRLFYLMISGLAFEFYSQKVLKQGLVEEFGLRALVKMFHKRFKTRT